MNILVTGATGFIASQIVTDLLAAGHSVTCCVRNTAYAQNLFPTANILSCDFIKDTNSDIWVSRLSGIDVVINCVGILYHPNKKIIWAIHYDTPRAIFDACKIVGVQRVMQISALGVEHCEVDYAKSKKAADDYLLSLNLNSTILRPSLVYGRGSYGGTSLFRGLASLPWVMPVPGNGTQSFQPIHIEDLSKAILKLLNTSVDTKILCAVGPKQTTLADILKITRSWLGFAKAKIQLSIPLMFIRLGSLFGDLIPYSAMNTTSYKMLMQNNIASAEEANRFHQLIGFAPRDFMAGMYSQPSTVQDHWHARLYFLRPLLQFSIAFVWLFSAISCLFFYPKEASYGILSLIGVGAFWKPILFYGASLLDAGIGIAMFFGYRLKQLCGLQVIIILLYTLIITWKLPYLWIEPFAPIAKNIPLLVAILTFMALESDR